MNNQTIKTALKDSGQDKVARYLLYCNFLLNEKKKDGQNWVNKNPWMVKRTDQQLIEFFKLVSNDGLEFDGKHITLQSTGVSYDYVAYKNKMLIVYPESLFDVQLVYKDDVFSLF